MTKDELVKGSIIKIEEFGLALEKSRCSKRSVQTLIKRIQNPKTETKFILDVYTHLNKMYHFQYVHFRVVWNLLPKETWAFYDMMGYEGLREQILLAARCKDFKIEWLKMPKHKDYHDTKKS